MKKLILALVLMIGCNFIANAQTGDPWIKKIYNVLYMRDPTAFEYNTQNYNGGTWGSYDELQGYIKSYMDAVVKKHLKVNVANIGNGQSLAMVYQDGKMVAGNLITNDGGSIVAQGGGNIVAQGGGNLQTITGIVAQGGGNLRDLKGLGFGANYGPLATGAVRIPISGKGAWVIQ